MAADAVYDAIRAYLEGTESTPPAWTATRIRWENEDFVKPEPPSPWIAVALTGVVYGQQSIGAATQADNRWDEDGTLWISVFAPVGQGVSEIRALCKQLADLFRGTTLLGGALEFMDAAIGTNGPAAEEGNWFELLVAIDWRRMEA
ncbi:hypothetical protein CCR97_08280 [Rhodoplanes elegans]|uniref:DUF3168 domain-containing protein n=1 Tax=Rhodoplanes elegans TaxID=29408 RepID=A0A327KSU4_9BRAD|nr:phage tail terminator-like protein [Rhodoplanes elegans]MBK5958116.1 hypothetical protein [Rhodoplanes elegans]MBK5958208.1 hypothetical protein [Rhodoplanes elegans]RAI41990.1 hypothetical protein CH338_01420 [Rhodoplanes elegans]